MSKQELIEKTIAALQKLPADKVAEVSDFTEFILQRNEDKEIENDALGSVHVNLEVK